jgi:hypothetical protein
MRLEVQDETHHAYCHSVFMQQAGLEGMYGMASPAQVIATT